MLHSHVIIIFSVGTECIFLNREIEVQKHALLTGKVNRFQKLNRKLMSEVQILHTLWTNRNSNREKRVTRKWTTLLDIRVLQKICNSEIFRKTGPQNWNRANNEYDIKESYASTTACLFHHSKPILVRKRYLWSGSQFCIFLEVFSEIDELTPHWESVDSLSCHYKSGAIATMISSLILAVLIET